MNVPRHSRAAAVATLLAAALVTGCGPAGDAKPGATASGKAAARAVPCTATRDEAVAVAASDYIKQAKPKPERFLIAAGTDSALGDAGLVALQDKGPTYLYPGDPALQAQVRAQLHEKGDYTTLLVVRQDATAEDRGAAVRLNGHYVGGETDGQSPGPRSYRLACDSTTWRVVDSRAGAGA